MVDIPPTKKVLSKFPINKDIKTQYLNDKQNIEFKINEDTNGTTNRLKRSNSGQYTKAIGKSNQAFSVYRLPPIKSIPELSEDDPNVVQKIVSEIDRKFQIDGVNPVDVSKKILLKCNIIRNRHEGISVLQKGNGHLIGSDKTVGEIYKNIYHKSI